MMQSFALMAVVTVLWAVYGYSIAFAEGTPFFGNFSHLFLKGVSAEPNADYAATIPQQTFMIYQPMFAIITPALITAGGYGLAGRADGNGSEGGASSATSSPCTGGSASWPTG